MKNPRIRKRTIDHLRTKVASFPDPLREKYVEFFDVFEPIAAILDGKNLWEQATSRRWEAIIPMPLLQVTYAIIQFEVIQEECRERGAPPKEEYVKNSAQHISVGTDSLKTCFRLFLAACGEEPPEEAGTPLQ